MDVYICVPDMSGYSVAMTMNKRLRKASNDFKVRVNMGGGALKKQLKKADACGARWALILGDQEIQAGIVAVKDLRSGEQVNVAAAELPAHLRRAVTETAR